ncbi:hypothetical protein SD70_14635 [Gordoniibacillus kamchatkensis]|uniref:Transposase n=1 Tax=Gordoniibacillus kamchatkensis TaxID=1590651 RepID=A0ABR5AI97_9BACL|nr:hypothetical protein [Paenibacillus sp. VKM B-2647]KIL40315.1 hypothetical protein SD70_14635 [Paenibacillus sp. VKM B-2647]
MGKTNKATITYRFDGKDRMERRPQNRQQEPQVIPLYREEFRVMEPMDMVGAAEQADGENGLAPNLHEPAPYSTPRRGLRSRSC